MLGNRKMVERIKIKRKTEQRKRKKKQWHRQAGEKLYAGRNRKMGHMEDTKNKNEYGTKKKEEKKWHIKEIEKEDGNDTDKQEKS
jgi:hypothetical protein